MRVYLLALAATVLLQTSHYTFYFGQDLGRSMIWSLVDWTLWFLMFSCLFYFVIPSSKFDKWTHQKLPLLLGICLVFPLVHILLSNLSFLVIYEPSRPFWEDILHQFSKKWFQNLFISFGLYHLFDWVTKSFSKKTKTIHNTNLEQSQNETKIILRDGKSTFQLFPSEIHCIASAKNYIVITTHSKEQIVVRKSISAIYDLVKYDGFIRINRSLILHVTEIHSIQKRTKYSYSVTTKSQKSYPIGRTYIKEVHSFFES